MSGIQRGNKLISVTKERQTHMENKALVTSSRCRGVNSGVGGYQTVGYRDVVHSTGNL